MATDRNEEGSRRIAGLSEFQTGVVFLFIAALLLLYVGYQIKTGIVYTKSGEMPLGPGLPWAWLTIETVGAVVGILRAVKMVRRPQLSAPARQCSSHPPHSTS